MKSLLHRLRRRRFQSDQLKPASPVRMPAMVEPLENRQLLSTTLRVTSVTADNRGEVTIGFNQAVRASSVSASSVVLYTPGPDKKIGTADDVRVHAAVTYDAATKKITIHGRLNLAITKSPGYADLGYRVRLISTKLLAANGTKLDGEFKGGSVASGNGKAGGDTNFKVTTPKGNPTARFSTSQGVIKVTLYQAQVPATVVNFLSYANIAAYDNTIIHRNAPNILFQGGGYEATLDGNNLPTAIVTRVTGVKLQAGISNVAGTIAMARLSDPNSATSQWFFNAIDNSASLDPHANSDPSVAAGYAVFGKTDAAGLAVVKAISAIATTDLTPGNSTAFNTVPETNGQFVVIRRVSILDAVSALT